MLSSEQKVQNVLRLAEILGLFSGDFVWIVKYDDMLYRDLKVPTYIFSLKLENYMR